MKNILTFIFYNTIIVLFIGCLAFLLNMEFNAVIIIPLAMIVGLIIGIIFAIPIINWLSVVIIHFLNNGKDHE